MRVLMSLLAVVALACGGGSQSPTAPSDPQIAGIWRGTDTLVSVVGGDCLESVLRADIGTPGRLTVRISQSGASLSGTFTADDTGLACGFIGTINGSQVALTFTNCDVTTVRRLSCPSGERRDMELVVSSGDGTVSGERITGTISDTWNTFVAGTRVETGPIVFQFSFSVSR